LLYFGTEASVQKLANDSFVEGVACISDTHHINILIVKKVIEPLFHIKKLLVFSFIICLSSLHIDLIIIIVEAGIELLVLSWQLDIQYIWLANWRTCLE